MAQAILVEADEKLRTILKLNLMTTLGIEVLEKKSGDEAIALLEILPSIDIIIVRDKINNEAAADKIINFLNSQKSVIPLVIIGKTYLKYSSTCLVESSAPWKSTIEMTAKILGMTPAWDRNLMSEEYVSVPAFYFLNINHSSMGCDVYIRVKKAEGLFQYVKRLHSTDSFQRSDIEKYIASGLKDFYITKDHFLTFVNFVTGQMVFKLDEESLHGKERIQLTAESYELTLERIHSIGVDDYTVEIVQESIKSMESSLKEGGALSNFFQLLKSNQMSYLYSHSYLCCLVLHQIIRNFEWCSPQIVEKISYLAYFHDMSLKEEHLIHINSHINFNQYSFRPGEKEKVFNHALESAKLVEKFSEIPSGVSTLIKEHHGTKSGIGFSDTLNLTIGPVSMIFVVVEHFVDELLKIKGTPTASQLNKIFTEMKKVYTKSTYAQALFEIERIALVNKATAY